jgi:hypothetical protein
MITGLVLMALLAPRSGSPEDRFWKWFSANSQRLLAIRSGDEPVAGELAAELAKVHPELTWEVGPSAEQRELAIGAGGIVRAFPAVKALVTARPSLVGWKVIAFRPRRDPSFSVRLGSYELKPNDVWFVAEADGQEVGLTVYVMGYEEGNSAAQQFSLSRASQPIPDVWADKALMNRKELRDEKALSVENVVEDQGLA